MPPQPGSTGQNRHRKWCRFSSYVGAANCATRTCRGSRWSTSRLMAPPLPEASQPSNTTHSGGADLAVAELAAEREPQLQQPALLLGQLLLLLLLRQPETEIHRIESPHGAQPAPPRSSTLSDLGFWTERGRAEEDHRGHRVGRPPRRAGHAPVGAARAVLRGVLFCLAIAVGAALDGHWPGAVVLSAVAFGLAAIADDARGRPLRDSPPEGAQPSTGWGRASTGTGRRPSTRARCAGQRAGSRPRWSREGAGPFLGLGAGRSDGHGGLLKTSAGSGPRVHDGPCAPVRRRKPANRYGESVTSPHVPHLLLASASPARLSTLRAAGLDPAVMVSGVDEDAVARGWATSPRRCWPRSSRSPSARRSRPSWRKPATLVVGCDSVLELDGEAQGKPADAAEAIACWHRMRGARVSCTPATASGRCGGSDPAPERRATASTTVDFADPD